MLSKIINFKYKLKPDTWNKIIEPSKSTYQEELNAKYIVEALKTYQDRNLKDVQLGVVPSPGSRWTVTKDRLDLLLGENENQEAYVKLIEIVKNNKGDDI